MSIASAVPLVNTHIQALLDQLPGIRRADPEAVHEARVATRRLREVLPLLTLTHPDAAKTLRATSKAIGQHLGRVRELDIMRMQLDTLDARVPSAAEALAAVRGRVRRAQDRRRRQSIKAVEKLKADRLRPIEPGDGRLLARMRPYATARTAYRTLREQIGARAHEVLSALDHATGVYFPKRLHGVRVAAKKLRYSVEAAETIGLWRPPRLLRDLRRIQARLGTLHDLQVLLDALDGFAAPRSETDAALLKAVVQGELSREYEEYLERADRMRPICQACERFASRRTPAERRVWPATAAAMAAHVGVALIAEKLAAQPSPRTRTAGQILRVTA